MRHLFLVFILALLCTAGHGQQPTLDLPRIIQPSPEAAALFRYIDYPMDYSTGLPDISVSVYEVKCGSLTVPISLSYHASGRRIYDQDGPVALGWSLNAGGMVSRTVYGAVDFGTTANGTFKFPYPFNLTSITNHNNLPYLEQLMHYDKNPDDVSVGSWLDGEYDVFSYSFTDHSGKFVFKDVNSVKTAKLTPYKPYSITPIYTNNGLTAIDILDDKGVYYHFVGQETTLQFQSAIETVPAITGYMLTTMISADKADTVSFQYTNFAQTRTTISQEIVWNDNETGFPGQPNDVIQEGPTNYENTRQDPYQVSRLTEIDFKQGKVIFNLVSGSDKINTIQVYNGSSELLRTIRFNRSALDNLAEIGYSTNKLDNLVFQDNASNTVQQYSFEYYPSYNSSPSFNVRYRDWWGFYNGSGVHDLVPYYTNLPYVAFNGVNAQNNYTIGNIGAQRNPNLLGLESGVLKKITFPTGGSRTFTYECNSYHSFNGGSSKLGPGLRVAQVKDDDANGNVGYRTYKYGENESGTGWIDMEPDLTNMGTENIYNHFTEGLSDYTWSYRSRVFNSDFISALSEIAQRPVIYTTVTEYRGTTTDNIGKTVYTYDYSGWSPAGMPAFESESITKMHIASFNYWNNASLIKQIDYKNTQIYGVTGVPVFKPVKEMDNIYNPVTLETVSGLHVQRQHVLQSRNPQQNERVLGPPAVYQEPYAAEYQNINIYTYNQYDIPIGIKNLYSTTETLFNEDNSQVTKTTTYSYNSLQQVSQLVRTASDGNPVTTQITYPIDYSGDAVLSQMVTSNMLNFPIETSETKASQLLRATKNDYGIWSGTVPFVAPQAVEAKKGSNPYETRIRYGNYDGHGKPVIVSKEGGVQLSYVYDYRNEYPIAEVLNAVISDVAYTSFEAEGTGGWSGINTANIVYSGALTGVKYYSFSGTSLSRSGLTTTTTYTVSYWSKNGSYLVNGGSGTAGRSYNGWTYYEHTISGATSITVSGTGSVDELRLYPKGAQMKTYCYKPQAGMLCACDTNNRLLFYDYDPFQRLQQVRDQDGNILKTYKYHFQTSSN